MKIGILGGTFDPVHIGHTALAAAAAEHLDLARVLFIPNARPPHKPNRHITPYEHRVNMLKIGLADCPVGELCEMEPATDAPNYTIDTIRTLKNNYAPDTRFFLILGADEAANFAHWRDPEKIMREVTVVVAARPGYQTTAAEGHLAISASLPNISSSEIRKKAAQNHSLANDLHPGVAEYITTHQLYSTIPPHDTPPQHPEKKKWTSVHGTDLLIGVPILWGVEIVLGIILVCWVGLSLQDHPVPILVVTCLSGGATLLVSWFLVCRKYDMSFCAGFRITRPSKKTVAVSVLIGASYALIATLLEERFSTGQSVFAQMVKSPIGLMCVVALALLLPPIEELYYRGFMFPAIQKRLGSIAATVIVVVWFAAAHVGQQNGDWIAVPVIALAGAIWTVQRLVSKTLTASIITHWTYNAVLVLITLASRALN